MSIYKISHTVHKASFVASWNGGQYVYCIGNGGFNKTLGSRFTNRVLLPAEQVAQYVCDILGYLDGMLIYFVAPKGFRCNLGAFGQYTLVSPHEQLFIDAWKQSGMSSFDFWSLVAGCCELCIFKGRSEFILSHVQVAGNQGLGILEIPTFGG